MTAAVTLGRGSLHLSLEIYRAHFAGLEGVILQRRGDDLLILPVRNAPSGGFLLKVRNARGDRIVCAADFFRSQGIEDDVETELTMRWDPAVAGLRADAVFPASPDVEHASD
jgi:hypothetical protein